MSKFQVTTLKVAIHRPNDNPIFGDMVTHVTLSDEAAGPFFVISQTENNEIKVTFEELEKISEVAREMWRQYPERNKS